jgi:hypothetical protein
MSSIISDKTITSPFVKDERRAVEDERIIVKDDKGVEE